MNIEIMKKSDVQEFFDKNGLDNFKADDIPTHSLYKGTDWVNGTTVMAYLGHKTVLYGNLKDTVSEIVELEETVVSGTYSTYDVVARNYFYWTI